VYISWQIEGLLYSWAVGLWIGHVFVVIHCMDLRQWKGCERDESENWMKGCAYDDIDAIIIANDQNYCNYYSPTPPPHAPPNSTYFNSSDEDDNVDYFKQHLNHYHHFDY